MKDVMLDIETLGNGPGCVILAIGAVYFDPKRGNLGNTFYSAISIHDSMGWDFRIDVDTLNWWVKEQGEAFLNVFTETVSAPKIATVLEEFDYYLQEYGPKSEVRVWGNGADFDNAIVQYAYRRLDLRVPWKYTNNRCYRTLARMMGRPEKKAAHNALEDAKAQALRLCQLYQWAKRKGIDILEENEGFKE